MKMDEWIQFFKKHREKSLFSFSDLLVLTNEDKSSLSVQLTRLVKSETLTRAAKGWYENPFNPPSTEEIAMVLRYPSYLSLEYALSKHGILSQRVHTLTLVTTKNTYTYSTPENEYEYHQVKRELFFGHERQNGIQIARPEKALLDLVYIRVVHSGEMTANAVNSLLDDMETDEFDREIISEYGSSFDERTRQIIEGMLIS